MLFLLSREKEQSVTQDWGNVWPGIRSFHPATVPLPVRMGRPISRDPPKDKWANAELMKIPNFLHLTPPVIKRQCEAIKGKEGRWCARGLSEHQSRIPASKRLQISFSLTQIDVILTGVLCGFNCVSEEFWISFAGFCTPWPKEIETEEAQGYHFPVTVTTSSYLHSSPSIRDPLARIVTMKVRGFV